MRTHKKSGPEFHLNKWFLDFVGEDNNSMIFYAAELTWRGITVPYASWLHAHPSRDVKVRSGLRNVRMPVVKDNLITWNDLKFGIRGEWKSSGPHLSSNLYQSDHGHLYWDCYQPSSMVDLDINGNLFTGTGYVEQLQLTAFPWKIPMDELRWGHFRSDSYHLVWIEFRKEHRTCWVWLNGEKINDCHIENDLLVITEKNIDLRLDKGQVLESEKKLASVVGKLVRYIPGFSHLMPVSFLMADEVKWLSHGKIQIGEKEEDGYAIHEYVNFNSNK